MDKVGKEAIFQKSTSPITFFYLWLFSLLLKNHNYQELRISDIIFTILCELQLKHFLLRDLD